MSAINSINARIGEHSASLSSFSPSSSQQQSSSSSSTPRARMMRYGVAGYGSASDARSEVSSVMDLDSSLARGLLMI